MPTESFFRSVRAQTERANALSRLYEAQVAGFRATVDKQVKVIRAQLGEYQTDASVYGDARQVYGDARQVYGDAARVCMQQAQMEAQMRAKTGAPDGGLG